MLAFGRNSTSYLPRGLRYNITELGDRPEDTSLQGRKFSLRDRVKHFALERFHQGQAVSEASVRSVFGVGLLETIGPDLTAVRELGALRETGEGLTLVAADRAELVANAMMLFAPELVGLRVSDIFEDPLVMVIADLRLTLRLRYGPPDGARLTLDIPELPRDSRLLGRLRALLAPIEAEGLDLVQARAAFASRINTMLGRIKGDLGAPNARAGAESGS
jgi:hypothetical protein